MFTSFDFSWWNTGEGSSIGATIALCASLPVQLMYNGAVFVAFFAGDAVDTSATRSAAGAPIYFISNFQPGVAASVTSMAL